MIGLKRPFIAVRCAQLTSTFVNPSSNFASSFTTSPVSSKSNAERSTTEPSGVANQIAGAIANAQLHAAVEREASERQALADISRVISSSPNIGDVYEQFVEQVRELIFPHFGLT